MAETKNIMIVGVGGQGTLLTSRILGGITVEAGYDVKLSEVHGMAQRGGSVVTYVRYGEKVAEPIVEEGQADGVIIVNDQRIDPMPVVTGVAKYPDGIIEKLSKKYRVVSVDAMDEAIKMGNSRVFNVIILGIAAKNMDFPKEQWIEVIKKTVPPKTIDINVAAFEKGYELA